MKIRVLAIIFSVLATVSVSCGKMDDDFIFGNGKTNNESNKFTNGIRKETSDPRRITLLYSLGVNNLKTDLLEDIDDLCSSWLPGVNRQDNLLMVFSHSGKPSSKNNLPDNPVLLTLRKGYDGTPIRDTVKVWPKTCVGSSAEMVREVLEYLQKKYKSASCGVVFSSHGTGWLPRNYYSHSSEFDDDDDGFILSSAGLSAEDNTGNTAEGKTEPSAENNAGKTDEGSGKSIRRSYGAHDISGDKSVEINIDELAAAIPYKLDYIIFDACLMGGIEVAYELKDACKYLVVSPTEILANGLDYVNLPQRLLGGEEAEVLGVCEDYFNQYLAMSGAYKSATISCIDCSKLEPLSIVCKELFSKYNAVLRNLPDNGIQRYFQKSYHWFYDLRSIFSHVPISKEEMERFDEALKQAVIYNEATDKFLSITIKEHCGLSSYLISNGSPYLDNYYKKLKWNKATSYVAE